MYRVCIRSKPLLYPDVVQTLAPGGQLTQLLKEFKRGPNDEDQEERTIIISWKLLFAAAAAAAHAVLLKDSIWKRGWFRC